MIENHGWEVADGISEEQRRNEPKRQRSRQHVMNEVRTFDESYLNRPPALNVNTDRKIDFDFEDDGKAITEEDNLVASMRGEEVSLSVMSDAVHEELWLPAE